MSFRTLLKNILKKLLNVFPNQNVNDYSKTKSSDNHILKGSSKMDFKQIIVVRSDLKMGKGKIAAQVAHASISSFELVKKTNPTVADEWYKNGMPKIVLKVDSFKSFIQYFNLAKDRGIPVIIISDAGNTQVAPGSKTCFAAGPWYSDELDSVFSKLRLL